MAPEAAASAQPAMQPLRWGIGGLPEAGPAADLAARAFDPNYREAWSEPQIAGLLALPRTWLDIGWQGDRLVSFAMNRMVDIDAVELLLCAVDPAMRRGGIGQAMMRASCASARGRGATRMFLEVRRTNAAALALYRGFGFKQIGFRPHYYRTASGESIDAVTLALQLV